MTLLHDGGIPRIATDGISGHDRLSSVGEPDRA